MDRQSSYARTRERLEEIVTQVKAKDVPLEKSLDLYEEALRLGSTCAEMIDSTDFSAEELESAGASIFEDAEDVRFVDDEPLETEADAEPQGIAEAGEPFEVEADAEALEAGETE